MDVELINDDPVTVMLKNRSTGAGSAQEVPVDNDTKSDTAPVMLTLFVAVMYYVHVTH